MNYFTNRSQKLFENKVYFPNIEKDNDDYRSKTGTKRKKVKMRNFLLVYLRYRGLYQIMSFTGSINR